MTALNTQVYIADSRLDQHLYLLLETPPAGWDRQPQWDQEEQRSWFPESGNPPGDIMKNSMGQAWCCMHVIPATQEAEAEGSQV
jgi:hypothetical protein